MPGMISSLPEEDVTKRIFSCIPGMVKKIEEEVSAYSSEDERKIFYEQYGVKLDQNNKVVKIKHDSAYLKKYLEEQLKDYPNISSYNKFNFYIDEYRDPQEDIKVFVKTSKKAKTTSDENEQYILGEGSFGKAKKVRTSEGDQDNLQYVVMKKIDKRKLASQEPIHNEIIALKAMNQYRGYIEIGEFVYIFSQFVPGSYLSRSNLSKEEKLSKKGLLEIAIQLVNQLIFLHSRGIFHFDIKHNNALYNINGQGQLTAQLIDFGSVRMLLKDALPDMDKISPEGMTIGFNLAPEAAGIWRIDQDKQDDNEKQNYQQSAYAKVDIYQLGLLFRNIGLPPLIYESMIIQNPLKRATLEEIKKNINKLKQELLVLEIIKLRTSVASRGGSKRANRETEPEPEPELKLPRLVAVPSDRRRSKHP